MLLVSDRIPESNCSKERQLTSSHYPWCSSVLYREVLRRGQGLILGRSRDNISVLGLLKSVRTRDGLFSFFSWGSFSIEKSDRIQHNCEWLSEWLSGCLLSSEGLLPVSLNYIKKLAIRELLHAWITSQVVYLMYHCLMGWNHARVFTLGNGLNACTASVSPVSIP